MVPMASLSDPYDPLSTNASVMASLAEIQALALQRRWQAACHVAERALDAHPAASALQLAYAGLLIELGQSALAEQTLRRLLERYPQHAAAAFLWGRLLRQQGRMRALAGAYRNAFGAPDVPVDYLLRAAEELGDVGRQADAAALCAVPIAAGCSDPRVHVLDGMLAAQLGDYGRARERHRYALAHSDQALEWHCPLALAELQRYESDQHEDVGLFNTLLARGDLSAHARSGILFALGKAYDDIGDYAKASHYLGGANTLARAGSHWSRKAWRRSVDARIQRRAPTTVPHTATANWTPVFIVGAPRSGTTLLAERLSRHPDVCLRGELNQLPPLATRLADTALTVEGLQDAACTYACQLRQDDSDARWFIDKQPFNFLHVDIALAMFPHARFLFCQRDMRDNALSLWLQSFQRGVQDFAYDLGDIAAVLQSARRLQAHWLERFPSSVRIVPYEELTREPARVLSDVSDWLGLPAHDLLAQRTDAPSIATASLWQARQAIHTRSVGRWRHYAPYLPELMAISEH